MKNNKVKVACKRCGISKKYITRYYATKKRSKRKYCTHCKLIPDDLLSNFIYGHINGIYKIKCVRCNTDKVYKNLQGFKFKIKKITTSCTYCKSIPNELLQNFKDGRVNGVYKIKCIKCDNNKTYKNLNQFKCEIKRTNTGMCRPCAIYKNSNKLRLRQQRNKRRREARLKIRQQDPNYYINEAKKKAAKIIKWKKKLKIAFKKYHGDNHWMKRPEVLLKTKKSCKKYRGDNHWFRIKGHFRYINNKKVYTKKLK